MPVLNCTMTLNNIAAVCLHQATHSLPRIIYPCQLRKRKCQCVLSPFSRVRLCDPCPVAHQAPLSMGFSRQEYWSGLPFSPPGDLPKDGTHVSCLLRWQVGSLPLALPGKPGSSNNLLEKKKKEKTVTKRQWGHERNSIREGREFSPEAPERSLWGSSKH